MLLGTAIGQGVLLGTAIGEGVLLYLFLPGSDFDFWQSHVIITHGVKEQSAHWFTLASHRDVCQPFL